MGREVLSQKGIEKVVMALANGGKEFSDKDALKVVQWARETIASRNLLTLILDGKVSIEILDDGELGFKSMEMAQ